MRTALAYLASLICHAAVLIPLAGMAIFSADADYAVRRGNRAVVLQASVAAAEAVRERPVQIRAELPPARESPDVEPAAMPPSRSEAMVKLSRPLLDDSVTDKRSSELEALPQSASIEARQAIDAICAVEPPHTQRLPRATLATAGTMMSIAAMSENLQGADIEPPQSLPSNPQPHYPAEAQARGLGGLVELRVCISADGSVERVSIARSSGIPSFDESALATVRDSWRFRPALRNGKAVPYEAILPIRFTIRAE